MTDRELLERIRAVLVEFDHLIEGAEANAKYYTKARLTHAREAVTAAEGSLAWHVEG